MYGNKADLAVELFISEKRESLVTTCASQYLDSEHWEVGIGMGIGLLSFKTPHLALPIFIS
jgi:hypothetical protein